MSQFLRDRTPSSFCVAPKKRASHLGDLSHLLCAFHADIRNGRRAAKIGTGRCSFQQAGTGEFEQLSSPVRTGEFEQARGLQEVPVEVSRRLVDRRATYFPLHRAAQRKKGFLSFLCVTPFG